MREYKYADLYKQERVIKHLNIEYPDGIPITCNEMHEENFELKEYLCSTKPLRFGTCEACSLKFRISNVIIPLKGKKLTVTETLGKYTDVSFGFGEYKVHSDTPDANRKYRDITAYDAMYDILNAEVSAWYNTILPNKDSTVTMKVFRCSFLDYLGIEYEDVTLINDDMVITKTIQPTTLAGKTVITAICEINGCFGHIGRDGKFQYIHLKEMVEGVYPSDTLYPSDDLYPADPMNVEEVSRSHYTNVKYEDFTTARINKLLIRKEENDVGATYPSGNVTESDNCYIVQDNFLLYGKSTEELEQIAAKMFSVISKVWYQPAHVEAKGNPCLEVGDGIMLETDRDIIYTYILQRTLKGIQALRDTYDAEGEQYQKERVNSVREDIIELKGKANILTRSIEETKLEMYDIEKGLNTEIEINAGKIAAEVERSINQDVELAAAISIEADKIAAEVKRASEAEGELYAKAELLAGNIALKVGKNEIISQLNLSTEKALIQAPKIDLVGLVEADEFISKLIEAEKLVGKFATFTELETINLSVKGKLDATNFTAAKISALGITVESANVTGTFSGNKISAGEIKSTNYESSSDSYTCGEGMRIDLDNGSIWWANGSIKASTGFMNSIGYEVPTSGGGYNLNFKSALAVKTGNTNAMMLGAGYSSVVLPSGAAVTSVVEKKANIIPCVNALSAVENTDVYYFNYKNDTVKRDNSQKVGFIIGEGYNLDARLLAESGDAIDTYNAIGLNWRATQQLYAKIKKQQEQIDGILSVLAKQEA